MSRMYPVVAASLVVLFGLSLGAPIRVVHAQVPAAGDRVRITSPDVPGGKTVGTLEQVTNDTAVVSGLAISRAGITQVEISTGRKSHWLAGAGIGLGAGAVLGVAITCPSSCGDPDNSYVVPLAGVALGAVGALAGGLVGGLFVHSERWKLTSLSPLRVGPMAGPNGSFGITLGLRF